MIAVSPKPATPPEAESTTSSMVTSATWPTPIIGKTAVAMLALLLLSFGPLAVRAAATETQVTSGWDACDHLEDEERETCDPNAGMWWIAIAVLLLVAAHLIALLGICIAVVGLLTTAVNRIQARSKPSKQRNDPATNTQVTGSMTAHGDTVTAP